MRWILYFIREYEIWFHELAHQSLCNNNPSHPDIPHILLTISRLKAERASHAQRQL